MNTRISFASDNNSGVHPAVMEAMAKVNEGNAPAYAQDAVSEQAAAMVRELFGPRSVPFFVLTGTAANILALKTMVSSYQAIAHTHIAHIHCDEGGAPEVLIGCKLRPVVVDNDGKLRPEHVEHLLADKGNPHHNQLKVLSIAQSTEWGTLYTPEEIRALTDFAHANDLYVHMDGARLANAAAALGLPFKAFTADVGVDVVSLGGTKNGLMMGEAVVFLNPALARNFMFIRKQGMQLFAKMRFVAAQFIAYLTDDLWLRNASNANAMAARLSQAVSGLPHVRLLRPTQANAVFARLSAAHSRALQEKYYFYTTEETEAYHDVRLMTSFNTTPEQVDAFAADIRAL